MGLKLAAVMAGVMVIVMGLGYWYYNDTQEKMAILHQNNAKLEQATKLQNETIKQLEGDVELAQNLAVGLQDSVKELRKTVEAERNKFNKQSKLLGSRDIGKMAVSKARPIQRIINKGTIDKMRCFEIVSGSKLTEKEINAQKPSQLNRSCPGIANPNRVQ